MELFTDIPVSAIESALDSVSARQKVAAHNVANVATPGFRASKVTFEENLAMAVSRGRILEATHSIEPTNGAARPDGNNVALEEETVGLIKSGLQYEALVQALNYKFGVLRTAIGRS